jgi:hypothetical protein
MNKIVFISLFFAAFASTSCNKNKNVPGCTDVYATNFNSDATDDDGSCRFPRDKFTGIYTGVKSCSQGANENPYSISIAPDPADKRQMLFIDFPENGAVTKARMGTTNINITFPQQTITNDLDEYSLSGSASENQGNNLLINIIRTRPGEPIDSCDMSVLRSN